MKLSQMNRTLLFSFSLLCQFCFGQIETRKLLEGQVINESAKVENVIVFNVNSKTGTVVDEQGFFKVLVKAKDTLVFSSLEFKARRIILSVEQCSASLLIVKLDKYTNELAEVIVYKPLDLKPINNSQSSVDQKFFDDKQSKAKINTMPSYAGIENGVDFVRIYKDVAKVFRNKNREGSPSLVDLGFTKEVMGRFEYHFFTDKLNLKDSEIQLFLVFCENDFESKKFKKTDSDFTVMDFLITKNKEFKALVNAEK